MRLIQRFSRWCGYDLLPRRSQAGTVQDLATFRPYFDATEGMTSWDEAAMLFELAQQVTSGCIVEVGSYRGRSAVALGLGALAGRQPAVYAVDPHATFRGVLGGEFGPEDRAAFYRAMLNSGCYQIVRLVNLSSEQVAPQWTLPIGLLWIDGDHTEAGVRRDWNCWSPHLLPTARIAWDDATDPAIGPYQLIAELLASGEYRELRQVGKARLLERVAQ